MNILVDKFVICVLWYKGSLMFEFELFLSYSFFFFPILFFSYRLLFFYNANLKKSLINVFKLCTFFLFFLFSFAKVFSHILTYKDAKIMALKKYTSYPG